MMNVYRVLDPSADTLGGVAVESDRTVIMTPAQAEHWLRMGAISPAPPSHPAQFHPLDHDMDGRPGGSLPGRRRKRQTVADTP